MQQELHLSPVHLCSQLEAVVVDAVVLELAVVLVGCLHLPVDIDKPDRLQYKMHKVNSNSNRKNNTGNPRNSDLHPQNTIVQLKVRQNDLFRHNNALQHHNQVQYMYESQDYFGDTLLVNAGLPPALTASTLICYSSFLY